ncbi:secreted RxLR effector protein 161-like [Malania oleifera]|uniref:secreted RxLR effector protein 161-like n=1 Tax=Malania oleifera TaxID=397392 RepID=UPI0025ADEC89|nr:secreted RxLR effector protein 161-like [Malania oleifera]
MEVKTAFLHSDLEELIYMSQPVGFCQPGQKHLVCKLQKSLSELKNITKVIQLKTVLSKEFDMKDLSAANRILGMEIQKMLERFSIANVKSVSTPLASHFRLSTAQCPKTDDEVCDMSNVPYDSAVGCLMYVMVCTRPELAQALNVVSKFFLNPRRQHWDTVKWILKYLRGITEYDITFSRTKVIHQWCYVDADYAGDLDVRRSTIGYIVTPVGGPICWRSMVQSFAALSTTKSEYMVVAEVAKEAIWLTELVKELGIQ